MRAVLTLLLLILAGAANAQIPPGTFAAYKATTLAGSPEVLTVQKASGDTSKIIQFHSATLYCSVACTIELEVDGSAASATEFTPIVLRAGTAAADAYHTTGAGNGTTINEYVLTAGQQLSIGLSNIRWQAASGLRNLTLRTDSITGDVKLLLVWSETTP